MGEKQKWYIFVSVLLDFVTVNIIIYFFLYNKKYFKTTFGYSLPFVFIGMLSNFDKKYIGQGLMVLFWHQAS